MVWYQLWMPGDDDAKTGTDGAELQLTPFFIHYWFSSSRQPDSFLARSSFLQLIRRTREIHHIRPLLTINQAAVQDHESKMISPLPLPSPPSPSPSLSSSPLPPPPPPPPPTWNPPRRGSRPPNLLKMLKSRTTIMAKMDVAKTQLFYAYQAYVKNDDGNGNDCNAKALVESWQAYIEYLKDQEERIRQDWKMCRNLIEEENQLVTNRLAHFSTLQGFLLAATSLSISSSPLSCMNTVYVLLIAIVGFVISIFAFINVRAAEKAITSVTERWDELQKKHKENLPGFTYIGPDVVGRRYADQKWLPDQFIPCLFIVVWLLIGVAAFVALCVLARPFEMIPLDLFKFGVRSSTNVTMCEAYESH